MSILSCIYWCVIMQLTIRMAKQHTLSGNARESNDACMESKGGINVTNERMRTERQTSTLSK